ncbi:MAG: Rieske 2Fe-2S domain-containing protein [Planctomycetes bacterium]|nr:Rieske 2Fe-2S domain-containing protein [Planctomycetota bacterium]
MATKQLVTKVWIEPGCIVCDACENTAPTVFEVTDDTCIIRPDALNAEFTKPLTQEIFDAAEECPVNVIKFDTVAVEGAEAEAPAPVAAAAEEPTAVAPATAAASAAAPAKHAAPAKPAAPAAAPAAAAVAASAAVSAAGQPDPSLQALLRAATARGGNAGLVRNIDDVPESVKAWKSKDPSELPPDARQARILEAARKARKNPDEARREFMSRAALTVGWVAFGGGLGVSIGPAFGRFMMPNVLEEPDPRVRVGKLQQFVEMQPGDVNEDYKPQGIWMIREDERVAALNIICTHLGCIPNWLPNDRKFKCPCHGSGYKPNGINFEGPTPRPLERFRVFIEDGMVVVDKSKKYQYELGQWDQAGSYLAV